MTPHVSTHLRKHHPAQERKTAILQALQHRPRRHRAGPSTSQEQTPVIQGHWHSLCLQSRHLGMCHWKAKLPLFILGQAAG